MTLRWRTLSGAPSICCQKRALASSDARVVSAPSMARPRHPRNHSVHSEMSVCSLPCGPHASRPR